MLELSFLANGSESVVYVAADGSVIKIPRPINWRLSDLDPATVQFDLRLLDQFGVTRLATELLSGPIVYTVGNGPTRTAPYALRQPLVTMRAVLERDLHNPGVRLSVLRMMRASCEMSISHGRAVDFVGLWAGKRFAEAVVSNTTIALAMDNLHLTEQGEVQLIDIGLMTTNPLAPVSHMLRFQQELLWLVISPLLQPTELQSDDAQFILRERGAWHKRAAIKQFARVAYGWSRKLLPQ